MGRRVATSVRVTSDTGEHVLLTPGSEVPDWAADQITNDAVYEPGDGEVGDVTGVVEDALGGIKEVVPGAPVPAGDDAAPDYEAMTVLELRALIRSRNEGRDESDRVPGDGNKADIVAALEADDESR